MTIKKLLKLFLPRYLLIQNLNYNFSNSVLLTFDDGPHVKHTPIILEKLEQYDAKSIFFVVGSRIKGNEYLLNQILEKGHIIGNHTYIHNNKKQPNFLKYYLDLNKNQNLLKRITGNYPIYFRPAKGIVSVTTLLVPKILNLHHIHWTVDVQDWKCFSKNYALKLAESLVNEIKPNDIVLLHEDNSCCLDILDFILPLLKSKNFNLKNSIDCLI